MGLRHAILSSRAGTPSPQRPRLCTPWRIPGTPSSDAHRAPRPDRLRRWAARCRIQSALTIDEAAAMNGLAILREGFDLLDKEGNWK
ncbi:MAG: hypothetical protein A2Y95_07085 [Deltaproteobacteria bacterium RBG_13_65_10]|nr:MAG: hypothetical protein A2Y95_07085 [Deltaproteobacteria bacterium RBG_13_65_10]